MRNRWLKALVPAVALATLPVLPAVSQAGIAVGVSITVAPPILPVYVQPPLPAPGYIWTPGYWSYGDDGYFWVPGTWVLPPQPGLLWTPGYWGWGGGIYAWHAGYWGPHVGFYGGVNYGFGYTGVGFQGGYWHGGAFFYNHAVVNVGSVHVTNIYNHTVVNVNNHVAFNGGPGGLSARATPHELAAEHEHHFEATSMQRDHMNAAAGNRELRASFNHGHPGVAATARPGEFSGHGVVAARGFSGPHGGPVGGPHPGGPAGGPHPGPVAQHPGGFENHGGPGGAPHPGGAPGGVHPGGGPGNPAAGHPGNFGGGHPGGAPGNPGGGHPANFAGGHPGGAPGGAPHPGGNFGGGHPAAGGGHPPAGGGHPAPGGGGRKPEGHR